MSLASLGNILTMGCVCSRETLAMNNRRFYVQSRLGEGGFSYVDLIEDRHNHKLYALKRITCHSKEDEQNAQTEIDYMNMFNHPNLVPCEESAFVPLRDRMRSVISEVLIAMPFYRRGSLQDHIETTVKKQSHIPEQQVLEIFRGICEGLRALHSHQPNPVTHRDVKPHNVMFADDGAPVLMDFGSMGVGRVEVKGASQARALQDLAAERCTMPYRAPELFNVESYCTVDERIDIWSLGCTLYAMCYGESPFDPAFQRGDSVALAVLGGNIKFPENSNYSSEIKDLITSMLAVSPSERPFIDWIIQRVESMMTTQENRV